MHLGVRMCLHTYVRGGRQASAICPLTNSIIIILGIQEEPKVNGTQCNERHLVKQSQLPDNQSPCNSGEDRRRPRGFEQTRAQSRGQRQVDGAVRYLASSEQRLGTGAGCCAKSHSFSKGQGGDGEE